jgi:hypothetical protein
MSYNPTVHERLIQAARERNYVTYAEISKLAGFQVTGGALSNQLGELFHAVVMEDLAQDGQRPILSAVALGKDGVRPGNGFFRLARDLKRLQSTIPRVEDAFWVRELNALYAYWEQHP